MYLETGDYKVRNGAIYVKTGIGGYGDIDVPLLNNIDMNGKNIQTVTPAEMTYLHGVTSDIQAQINAKTSYPSAGEQAFLDADHTKLDTIENSADVTDADNVNTAGAVMESDYNAHTILRAIANNTPLALTVGEQTLVGRITGGNITALTPTQIRTLINVADGADVSPWTTVANETYLTIGTDEIVSTGGLTIRDSGTHPLTIENDDGDESGTIYRTNDDLTFNSGTGGGIALISINDITNKLGDDAGVNYWQLLDSANAIVLQVDSNGVISGGGTAVHFSSTTTITNTLGDNAGSYSFIVEDSGNNNKFEINSDADTLWTMEADSTIKIDADTTNHTIGSIFTIDAGINSATVDVIDLNITVGTALSASEVVTGWNLSIDGDGGDDVTSIIRGMYLEYGGTSSGISRALHFEGSWDYEIYCGGDLKIGMDTNDGTTSFEIWNSDDSKVIEIDSDGTIQGTLAGSEFETANDCAVAALTIDQNDDDQPFLKFEGVGAADQTKNFSNVNGDGAASGPLLYSSNPGWIFVGMVRHEMEDTANVMSDQDVWVPLYIPNTS